MKESIKRANKAFFPRNWKKVNEYAAIEHIMIDRGIIAPTTINVFIK